MRSDTEALDLVELSFTHPCLLPTPLPPPAHLCPSVHPTLKHLLPASLHPPSVSLAGLGDQGSSSIPEEGSSPALAGAESLRTCFMAHLQNLAIAQGQQLRDKCKTLNPVDAMNLFWAFSIQCRIQRIARTLKSYISKGGMHFLSELLKHFKQQLLILPFLFSFHFHFKRELGKFLLAGVHNQSLKPKET